MAADFWFASLFDTGSFAEIHNADRRWLRAIARRVGPFPEAAQHRRPARKELSRRRTRGINRGMNYLTIGIIGLIGGVTSGLFGVGGGVVMVPAMMLFLGMGIKQSVGTSLAVIIPTAMMGTFQHHRFDQVSCAWLCRWHRARLPAGSSAPGSPRKSTRTI